MRAPHRVKLSNGSVLLLEESEDRLHIAILDGIGQDADAYICTIEPSGVLVMPNSGDGPDRLTRGLGSDPDSRPAHEDSHAAICASRVGGECTCGKADREIEEEAAEAQTAKYAQVVWGLSDITSTYEVTDEQAADFLNKYGSGLQDILVERGWEAISTYASMAGLKKREDGEQQESS